MSRTLLPLIGMFLLASQPGFGEDYELKANLDPFLSLPSAYEIGPEDLVKMFPREKFTRNPYFQWLTRDKSRAIFKRKPAGNVTVDMTIMGGKVAVHEMIVDFRDGKYRGVIISIHNRGDSGDLSRSDFDKYMALVSQHLGEQLAARPNRREGKIERGELTSGLTWISGRGMAVLEHNPGVRGGQKVSFLRMRLARRDAGGTYEAALQDRISASVRTGDLVNHVRKDLQENVYVANVPMVDQGAKGYCVVASVQRLFEYYGAPCDMHQLAEIARSDPNRGTNIVTTDEELSAIDHLFKMRYDCLAIRYTRGLMTQGANDRFSIDDFRKTVKKYTNLGVPLLWALQVGRFQEVPPLRNQGGGGHMRLIIGYNESTDHILFSDSWGAGHELKMMKFGDAYQCTDGVFMMKPVTN